MNITFEKRGSFDAYPEPIWEDGLRAQDMIMFELALSATTRSPRLGAAIVAGWVRPPATPSGEMDPLTERGLRAPLGGGMTQSLSVPF
jgi:hypothetical protein